MLKKIFVALMLSAILLVSLIWAVNAEQRMLTYTNEKYGFSIEYPEDWTVEEGMMGVVVVFIGPLKDDFVIRVNIGAGKLPTTMMTLEKYAKARREWLSEDFNIVTTFSSTINNKSVIGHTATGTMEGVKIKAMEACFVNDTTTYTVSFNAAESTYDEATEKYFDPMLHSFKVIEKKTGIVIQNVIVTPCKVETGEEVKVKFEAMNKADVVKTKVFHLFDIPLTTEHPEEIDFKTVTLAPGETEIIEFTYIPKEAGAHFLSVENQAGFIKVTEAAPEKGIPGFEATFAIIGLLAVAHLLRRRG